MVSACLLTPLILNSPVNAATNPSDTRISQYTQTRVLSRADEDRLRVALQHTRRGNWSAAKSTARQIKDEDASKIVTWIYLLDKDSGARFDEIVRFMDQNPTWPRQRRLLEAAEKAIPKDMSASQVITWFAGREPLTGEGKYRLGTAHLEAGNKNYGESWIIKAWVEHDFRSSKRAEILRSYGDLLEGDPHERRLSRLLWDRQRVIATDMLPLVNEDHKKLAKARMDLMRGAGSLEKAVQSVPESLQGDPGFLYDQVQFLRKKEEFEDARALLLSVELESTGGPTQGTWWNLRHRLVRSAIDDLDYQSAYLLARNHGQDSGRGYAEAEWLAGWIALRKLDKPTAALKHFQKLYASVQTPISLARATYWAGRAAEQSGDKDRAKLFYDLAAAYPTTYYGQLAAEKITQGELILRLPKIPETDDQGVKEFMDGDLIKIVRILNNLKRGNLMQSFLYHLADEATTIERYAMLGNLARELGHRNFALRIAKKALRKNIVLPDHSYPIVDIPDLPATAQPAEPALVLGLSRQESEFNAKAVSPVGARGLMQLMPGTARIVARKHKLQYQERWLTSNPAYNAQLGAVHLGDLIADWDGSYILALISYNAGPGRARRWIEEFGDPRSPDVDQIDWVERIPFSETRNYVQRVLENTQVYRGRLAGGDRLNIPIIIGADLTRTTASEPVPPYHQLAGLENSDVDFPDELGEDLDVSGYYDKPVDFIADREVNPEDDEALPKLDERKQSKEDETDVAALDLDDGAVASDAFYSQQDGWIVAPRLKPGMKLPDPPDPESDGQANVQEPLIEEFDVTMSDPDDPLTDELEVSGDDSLDLAATDFRVESTEAGEVIVPEDEFYAETQKASVLPPFAMTELPKRKVTQSQSASAPPRNESNVPSHQSIVLELGMGTSGSTSVRRSDRSGAELDAATIPEGCKRFIFDEVGNGICADDLPTTDNQADTAPLTQ